VSSAVAEHCKESKERASGKKRKLSVIEPKITLKLRTASGCEVNMRVRLTTPMRRIFDAYCRLNEVDAGSVRFSFDGKHIGPDETALSLEMEDEDIIDVFV
jgi:small ubiquitin-related modifier